jgi:hypothetical protein
MGTPHAIECNGTLSISLFNEAEVHCPSAGMGRGDDACVPLDCKVRVKINMIQGKTTMSETSNKITIEEITYWRNKENFRLVLLRCR